MSATRNIAENENDPLKIFKGSFCYLTNESKIGIFMIKGMEDVTVTVRFISLNNTNNFFFFSITKIHEF
jgi:hypothetical protein